MLYIKFQVSSSSGSLVLQPTKGVTVTDRQTDGQTDGPKPICPLNFSEVGGIKMAQINKLSSCLTGRLKCLSNDINLRSLSFTLFQQYTIENGVTPIRGW